MEQKDRASFFGCAGSCRDRPQFFFGDTRPTIRCDVLLHTKRLSLQTQCFLRRMELVLVQMAQLVPLHKTCEVGHEIVAT